MKTKEMVVSIVLIGFLYMPCKTQIDLVNDEFPEAKEEVMKTFGEMAQSIKDGDMDKLISFHAYSPKFTEFKTENYVTVAMLTKHMNAIPLAL